jgi:hypothetical protein
MAKVKVIVAYSGSLCGTKAVVEKLKGIKMKFAKRGFL